MADGWLQTGDIKLHSGRRSAFKIECDDLTDDEMAAMCSLLAKALPPFGSIAGVPTGGYRVEVAMAPYMTKGPLLIVDDVWTTGGSVEGYRTHYYCPTIVAVLFARGPTPPDVTALFTLHDSLWDA